MTIPFKITTKAAKLVARLAKLAENEIGSGFFPVLVWKTSDTGVENFTPEIGIGFVEIENIDKKRVMNCNGKEINIYQYIPDDLLIERSYRYVALRNNKLVLVPGRK